MMNGINGETTKTTEGVDKAGEKAFKQHLQALEEMIKGMG